jgi:hypothetical protein
LKSAVWHLSINNTPSYKAYGTQELQPLPCWIYGEIYHARNDFLHGNPITPSRLDVQISGQTLFRFTAPLYRMALTAYLNLKWDENIPPVENAEAFGKYVSDHIDYTHYQRAIEAGIASILKPVDEE